MANPFFINPACPTRISIRLFNFSHETYTVHIGDIIADLYILNFNLPEPVEVESIQRKIYSFPGIEGTIPQKRYKLEHFLPYIKQYAESFPLDSDFQNLLRSFSCDKTTVDTCLTHSPS